MNRRAFLSTVTGGLLAAPLAAGCQQAGLGAHPRVNQAVPPALPTPVNHLMSGPNRIPEDLGGITVTVGRGREDLYTALGLPDGKQGATPCLNADGTHRGNTYQCPAGAVYSWMRLPLTTGTGWTCIRSNAPDLPPFGTRIMGTGNTPNLANASKLFKIETAGPHQPDQQSCIAIPVGSSGWRFVGIECGPSATTGPGGYGLVWLGGSRICIERSWIHGYSTAVNVIRGIYIQTEHASYRAEDIQIWDSWINEVKHDDADNQAIYMGLNRRTHIENCHVSGSCMDIMVGSQGWGAYGQDIVIRRNHLYKPMRWFPFLQDQVTRNPEWDGHLPKWSVKNNFESKNARLMLIEGNVIENAISCPHIVHNTQDLDLTDVTWQHNIFKNGALTWSIGIQSTGRNYRIKLYNNLWLNATGMAGWHTWHGHDIWVEHNSFMGMFPSGSRREIMGWEADPGNHPRYTLKRNIIGRGNSGFFLRVAGGLDVMLPDRVWAENAVYDASASPAAGMKPFASLAAAGVNGDGTLKALSPLKVGNAGYFGTDGKDIGVDFEALSVFMQTREP